MSNLKPFVSVLTPTYNRRKFLPSMIKCYMAQTYPKDRMEWIILDDGTDCVRDVFEGLNIPNLRYVRYDTKMLIGKKRNLLHHLAVGEFMIAMDDDDYYHPERVSHVVHKFMLNPTVELAGSSQLFIFYTDNKKIYQFGPYQKNHATNGTMASRKSYAKTHLYDETVTHAEEKSYLENYRNGMVQLDPFKVMLVISHSENTFDKRAMRDQVSPFVKLTQMKIKDFIRDTELRNFYGNS